MKIVRNVNLSDYQSQEKNRIQRYKGWKKAWSVYRLNLGSYTKETSCTLRRKLGNPCCKVRGIMIQSTNDERNKQILQFAYILKWRQLEILRIEEILINKPHFHLWQCFPECSNFGFPNDSHMYMCNFFIVK